MDIANYNSLTGNPAVLRHLNRVRIMGQLRREGGSTRVQMSHTTGLDPKTVTNLCNDLLESGLILPQDTQARGRGRPAERLRINPDAALTIGVDLGAQQVSAILMDLSGEVRASWRQEYGHAKEGKFLLKEASGAIRRMIDVVPTRSHRTLHGIGICVPGLLSRRDGIVVRSVNIRGFRNLPIIDVLDEYGLPMALEESSRSMALAEKWFGRRDANESFICMDLGFGIGMGIVHNGLLYRGANELSGEIGHTVVDPKGSKCRCGKVGCLEAVASGRTLGELAVRLRLTARGANAAGAKSLHEAALQSDPRARRALADAGRFIGVAIANIISLFDPGTVVLNGGLIGAGEFLTTSLRQSVHRHRLRGAPHACNIEISTLGNLAGAMGAAMLPLRRYFEFDNIQFQTG